MGTQKTLSWLVAIAGVWGVIAPFILGFTDSKTILWNSIITGAALIILGVWAAISDQETTVKTLDWIKAILGVWLIIAPFVLNFSTVTAALWNDIILGIVVAVLSGWAALVVGRQMRTA